MTATKALVLQGGGALGSYQAGVYHGLFERDSDLDWVAGISIGAINAALIAGNAPADRLDRLKEFWQLVTSNPTQVPIEWGDRVAVNQWSAMWTALLGVPGFFRPRMDPALLLGGAAKVLSYYDTAPLKLTLERLVDFDRINHGEMRLSVGAVNVRSGNSIYFDNTLQKIGVEHIMASSALPPGFAPVIVEGEEYWDGGIVSNTPSPHLPRPGIRAGLQGLRVLPRDDDRALASGRTRRLRGALAPRVAAERDGERRHHVRSDAAGCPSGAAAGGAGTLKASAPAGMRAG